jgi:hypothetical protein
LLKSIFDLKTYEILGQGYYTPKQPNGPRDRQPGRGRCAGIGPAGFGSRGVLPCVAKPGLRLSTPVTAKGDKK